MTKQRPSPRTSKHPKALAPRGESLAPFCICDFPAMKRLFAVFALTALTQAACIPITKAKEHINDSVCVTGKVLKVAVSRRSGTHFLNFCEDYRDCPFSVVVFGRDLTSVGDVRWLEGKT